MIFEHWELVTIEKALDFTASNSEGLSFDCLKLKIEQVLSSTKTGRFTLHSTTKNKPNVEFSGELLEGVEENE